jgi:hypothetical protein
VSCFGCSLEQLVQTAAPVRESELQPGSATAVAKRHLPITAEQVQLQVAQAPAVMLVPKEMWQLTDYLQVRDTQTTL